MITLVHIYWAAGGSVGKSQSVPSIDGKPAFTPTSAATIGVAVALAVASAVMLGSIGWFGDIVPQFAYRWLAFAVALIFLLRAVGDFELVGFFKKPNDSPFAFWDTRIYSPLCAALSAGSAYVAFA